MINVGPLINSIEAGNKRMRLLDVPREPVDNLGKQTVQALFAGGYRTPGGNWIELSDAIKTGREKRQGVEPRKPNTAASPLAERDRSLQIFNAITIPAAQELLWKGKNPLVLYFARGKEPGGHFLIGGNAQEENLC